jgi:UDP-N-acetylglucosamine 2-epimerase
MFDSVLYNLKLAEGKSAILEKLELAGEDYYLATVHRAENTDDPKRLGGIFTAFQEIAAGGTKLICPLHPRTRKALSQLSMGEWHSNLILIEPVSYLEMLFLEKSARLILTDSGGVQKEAFILRTPCITLREETEWMETVEAGWNLLVGADREGVLRAVEHFNSRKPGELQIDPYGDGRAGERLVEVIVSLNR